MFQNKTNVVFVSGFSGTSKKGNKFNMLTFYQIVPDKSEDAKHDLKSKQLQFFVDELPETVSSLQFGDVVEIEYEQPEFLDQQPELVGLKFVEKSPYVDCIQRGVFSIE